MEKWYADVYYIRLYDAGPMLFIVGEATQHISAEINQVINKTLHLVKTDWQP